MLRSVPIYLSVWCKETKAWNVLPILELKTDFGICLSQTTPNFAGKTDESQQKKIIQVPAHCSKTNINEITYSEELLFFQRTLGQVQRRLHNGDLVCLLKFYSYLWL